MHRIGRVIENDKFSIGVKSCRSEWCTQKLGRLTIFSLVFSTFPPTSSWHSRERIERRSQTDSFAAVAKTAFERNVAVVADYL